MTLNLWGILKIQLKAFESLFFVTSPRTIEKFLSVVTAVIMEKSEIFIIIFCAKKPSDLPKETETESWIISTYF